MSTSFKWTQSLSYSARSPCTIHRMPRPYADGVLSPTSHTLSAAKRRELGAFYTPVDVAEGLVAIAIDGVSGSPLVCDPSCGDGVFLLAAGRALEARGIPRDRIARDLLWGVDVDATAVDAARSA